MTAAGKTSPAPRLTLLILVDALRPDYVERTKWLRRFAATGATGALRECFGFVPRAAYFGGLDAEQYGFTNMYCFDPERSPFGMAAVLPASPAGAHVEARAGLRSVLEVSAKDRMAPFARAYGTSAEIPMAFLPSFDLVEQRAPWDKKVGYKSLFALLDERGIPWLQSSWPDSTRLADASDAGIVKDVLARAKPEHRFAYVHLQELDGVGHAHGPNSAELQRTLERTDTLCRELIEGLRPRYTELDVVLFGDHGMVNVTRTLDVRAALEETGLKFGADFAYFLDSTMARLWFRHASAKEIALTALGKLDGGHVLTAREKAHFGIAGCDRRNGEEIFLADPGVLIFPNFFQGHGDPIKGMHGYDPDCPDNLGFFLLHSTDNAALAGRALGRVNPPALFPLLCHLLGLPVAKTAAGGEVVSPERTARFTAHPDPAADATVAAHLEGIVAAVQTRIGPTQAIVLTGSFGRGEGGVHRDTAGTYRPVNDYDLLVVDPRPLGAELKQLGDALALELGLDYVDLGCSDGHWERLPLSVQHYDLKYGSQVIAGDATVLDRIPAYASADLPAYEAVKLLLNRTAGLLTGLRGEMLDGIAPAADARRYLVNQINKALLAIADWHLIRWEGYDASYRRRGERFQALARGAGVPARLAGLIASAYEFKARPDYAKFTGSLDEIRSFHSDLELSLVHAINFDAEGHARDLSAAMTLYLAHMSADAAAVDTDNDCCARHPNLAPHLKPDRPSGVSLRHLVYSVLPHLLRAAIDPAQSEVAFAEVVQRLEPFLSLPARGRFTAENWEQLRAFVIKLWFAICH